jgi:hypothetical protein
MTNVENMEHAQRVSRSQAMF